MLRSIKVTSAGLVALVLVGGSAAYAIASSPQDNHSVATPVAQTSTTTLAEVAVQQDAESVAPTTTTAPPPTGPSKEEMTAAQQTLYNNGYWLSAIDGLYGPSTQQALMAFQKLNGLPKSGQLDKATQAALTHIARPVPASKSGDLIEIDKSHQVIFIIRAGQMLWAFNTSTATEKAYLTNGIKGFAHTPTGTFPVIRTVDAVDPGPLGPLYRPRYFTNNGIAIHGAAAIPNYPASHGCARVSNAAMDFIWANNLMPVGSLVWVYDNPLHQPFTPPPTAAPATTTTAAPPTTVVPTTTTTAPATTSTTTSSLVTLH